MKVLHIDSSVRFERSISRQLSARMVQQLKAQFPNIVVDYLDLAKNPPAHPTELFTAAMYTPPAEQSPEMKAVLMASDELIDRMLRADLYVIGTPMYNFSVPSILKAFIDNVVRIGRTFVSDAQGYRGLLGEKKLILVNTRGADFTLDHFKAMDHLGPYIKSIFAFMGLHDIEWVDVHPVQYFGEEAKLAAIARAKKQIDALAIRLGQSANQLLGE